MIDSEVFLQTPPTVEPPPEEEKSSSGPKKNSSWLIWVCVLGVILIFLFGGLFYLSMQMKSGTPITTTQNPTRTATPSADKNTSEEVDQQSVDLKNVSKDDTPATLSRDINNTDLSGIDREMDQINSELNSSR